MLKVYKRKLIAGLLALLVVFAIIFALALLDIRRGIPMFGSGLGFLAENAVIAVLCILAMIKVIAEIARVEK
ncbi:hypothetical protein H8D36_02930 [archaeon]|nr:hypothetical protein [archaeon]MBL7057488.1 hypothetical protein [Candidatus Woesearchaeota archaeon]